MKGEEKKIVWSVRSVYDLSGGSQLCVGIKVYGYIYRQKNNQQLSSVPRENVQCTCVLGKNGNSVLYIGIGEMVQSTEANHPHGDQKSLQVVR